MMFLAIGRAPDRQKMMFSYACQDVLEEVSARQALISQFIHDLERFEVDVLSDCSAAKACRVPLQRNFKETGGNYSFYSNRRPHSLTDLNNAEHFKRLKDEISKLKSLARGEDKKVV